MTDTTSYIERTSTLTMPGWEFPAALTLPASFDANVELPSAILLVPGSLFSDVNGDYPAWNSFPHVYAHLARQLSARGHAVFRYAKPGPGTGSVETKAADAIPRTWDGRLAMTKGAFDGMRRALAEHGVRVARTIGAGHSEGSVAVSRLALSEYAQSLDGVVLLAGPSLGILGIMREQIAHSVPAERVDEERRRLDAVIEHLRRNEPVPAALTEGAGMGAATLASMPEEGRRYMLDVEATDPVELARRMTQPTLVVQGGNDSSVPTHHGETLRDAVGARGTYLFVPDVTHMFKIVPPDVAGPEAFGYPGPVDARIVDGINAWIRGLPVPR